MESPFEFLGSRQLGGVWLLDQVWKRLRLDRTLQALVAKRGYTTPVERLLFALVNGHLKFPTFGHQNSPPHLTSPNLHSG
jgi:hypothetical protein